MDSIGKRRCDRLVSWVEKASLERIRRLLDITKAEHNHELLLLVKNLSISPFRYIILIIPRSLPEELVKREHFFLTDLLRSIQGRSSQLGSTKEPQAETAQETSATFTWLGQLPLNEQDSRPALPSNEEEEEGKDHSCRCGVKGLYGLGGSKR